MTFLKIKKHLLCIIEEGHDYEVINRSKIWSWNISCTDGYEEWNGMGNDDMQWQWTRLYSCLVASIKVIYEAI